MKAEFQPVEIDAGAAKCEPEHVDKTDDVEHALKGWHGCWSKFLSYAVYLVGIFSTFLLPVVDWITDWVLVSSITSCVGLRTPTTLLIIAASIGTVGQLHLFYEIWKFVKNSEGRLGYYQSTTQFLDDYSTKRDPFKSGCSWPLGISAIFRLLEDNFSLAAVFIIADASQNTNSAAMASALFSVLSLAHLFGSNFSYVTTLVFSFVFCCDKWSAEKRMENKKVKQIAGLYQYSCILIFFALLMSLWGVLIVAPSDGPTIMKGHSQFTIDAKLHGIPNGDLEIQEVLKREVSFIDFGDLTFWDLQCESIKDDDESAGNICFCYSWDRTASRDQEGVGSIAVDAWFCLTEDECGFYGEDGCTTHLQAEFIPVVDTRDVVVMRDVEVCASTDSCDISFSGTVEVSFEGTEFYECDV